jgi:hypothetical protein
MSLPQHDARAERPYHRQHAMRHWVMKRLPVSLALVFLVVVVAALIAGCTNGPASFSATFTQTFVPSVPGQSSDSNESQTPDPTTPVEAVSPQAAFEDITLEGKGKKVAQFAIPYGEPAIAVITHTGKTNFIVRALDATGGVLYHLVDVTGDYKGTVLFDWGEEGQSVAFAIDADGTWTITIKPVSEALVWDPTMPLKGTGDNVYQIVPASSGLVLLNLAYTGNDHFNVHAYSPDGREGLADEIGDSTRHVWMSERSGIIDVDADTGSWSIVPG